MYAVCVQIQVIPEHVEAFIAASLANARGTRTEPGNRRFDVLRHNTDAARFFLYEIYVDEDAFRAHQQTAHYLVWRDTVALMMAAPRVAERYTPLAPEPWA
ncbi:MAG: antibiotic biosynthesis monooxygenase [Deltaproteobacteria bacterium]|nr:antibiotic biosynthesis monooxygenase [Deltaproteobacteria bacterium]